MERESVLSVSPEPLPLIERVFQTQARNSWEPASARSLWKSLMQAQTTKEVEEAMFLPQVIRHRREVKLSLFWKMPECALELTSKPR
jgi:hypothetical protein